MVTVSIHQPGRAPLEVTLPDRQFARLERVLRRHVGGQDWHEWFDRLAGDALAELARAARPPAPARKARR